MEDDSSSKKFKMADSETPSSPKTPIPPPHQEEEDDNNDDSSSSNELQIPDQEYIPNFEFCPICISDYKNLEMLIKEETNSEMIIIKNDEKTWLKSARLDAMKWIMDLRTSYKLHVSTAYLACLYLDRIVTPQFEDYPSVYNISFACLSLAAKMDKRIKAPPLSKYSGVLINGHKVEVETIKKMELFVLNTLEWEMMISITPFAYIYYFRSKFFGIIGDEDELIVQAGAIILIAMKEIHVANQRPSIVAAAAVLGAYDLELTKVAVELKVMLAVPDWGAFEKEQLFSCYKVMQEMVRGLWKSRYSGVVQYNSDHSTVLGSPPVVGTTKKRISDYECDWQQGGYSQQ